MSNQPKTPKTLEELPYTFNYKPEMFRDDIDLARWLSDQPIDTSLKDMLAEKEVAGLSPLLDEIAEVARSKESAEAIEPDKWFMFRKKDDKRGDFRAITPEFSAPPHELTATKATRLYLFPPSEHYLNGLVAIEKRADFYGEDNIYRGQEMLWTPGDERVDHLGIRDSRRMYINLGPDDPANEQHRSNAVKNIVAAYVKLCVGD